MSHLHLILGVLVLFEGFLLYLVLYRFRNGAGAVLRLVGLHYGLLYHVLQRTRRDFAVGEASK